MSRGLIGRVSLLLNVILANATILDLFCFKKARKRPALLLLVASALGPPAGSCGVKAAFSAGCFGPTWSIQSSYQPDHVPGHEPLRMVMEQHPDTKPLPRNDVKENLLTLPAAGAAYPDSSLLTVKDASRFNSVIMSYTPDIV